MKHYLALLLPVRAILVGLESMEAGTWTVVDESEVEMTLGRGGGGRPRLGSR